jgi:hypothetical protein
MGASTPGSPPRALGPIVFLLSGALLSFEVILVRVFAIETFSHLTYMAVGLALLGFAGSGTVLVLLQDALSGLEPKLMGTLVVLSPLVLLGAPVLAHLPRYDPTQLLWDPGQWWALAFVYGSLSLPFVVGGGAIVLALRLGGDRLGRIYAWNMAGSGAGTLLSIPLLAFLRPDAALAATAGPASLAATLVLFSRRRSGAGMIAAGCIVALTAAASWKPPQQLSVSDFKALPQVEMYPDAQRVGESWDATGWVVAVQAPALRHAPGLSLGFRGTLPRQTALFVDGERAGAVSAVSEAGDRHEFLAWLPSSVAYAVGRPETVLVLGAGGGTEVLNALAHGARAVTAVELVAPLVELAAELEDTTHAAYTHRRVRVLRRDARSFASRTKARFERVILSPAGVFNATASGVLSSGQDFLNTAQGYRSYLEILSPGGFLSITRWLRNPPRDNVKVILTAAEALDAMGVTDPGERLVFLRSWSTGTLLVKPDGFTGNEVERIRRFARERYFDVDWPPADERAQVFNAIDRPTFEEAARAVTRGGEAMATFADEFGFEVAPPTDDRPYFGRFLPLRVIPTVLRDGPGQWLPVAEWGTLAVVATLVQGGLLAVILMGLPVLFLAGRARTGRLHVGRVAAYFFAIGLGYLFVEIAAIQRLALVLGHPVYATAAALGALLVFSGVGSALSDRIAPARADLLCAVVAGGALLLAMLASRTGPLMALPLFVRAATALGLLTVAGLFMGTPFPLGLRLLAHGGGGIAWAWAANGVASVMGAALGTLISMEVGIQGLIGCGATCYAAAAWVVRRGRAAPEHD